MPQASARISVPCGGLSCFASQRAPNTAALISSARGSTQRSLATGLASPPKLRTVHTANGRKPTASEIVERSRQLRSTVVFRNTDTMTGATASRNSDQTISRCGGLVAYTPTAPIPETWLPKETRYGAISTMARAMTGRAADAVRSIRPARLSGRAE